jgi:type I restriction-modification system DNA methylase subunit
MKEIAKKNLAKLIEKFERELAAGKIKDYNEEATKTAFIQPLLKDVLGWDVTNRDEVSPEEKISRGRVDYGLKVEGKIKVFVEAKPPRADLNKHIEQAVRYGYNRKGVPFVLLTDFEELKLFDVTVKPDSRNPRKGLKIDLRWNNYLKEFDKIWLLSKESVIKGELDKLLLVKPKDRLPVDKAILDDLKRWRESLAKDIFKNNRNLFGLGKSEVAARFERQKGRNLKVAATSTGNSEKDADYLKEITQRILDRIIFMRFCEDRNFVHRRPLKELFEERTETVGLNTMVFLKEEFKHYNLTFDSDLFRPQDWESNLAIDFKIMKDIVLDTYNPYQFDVIPLEVLGNIYEQYLGYTIRLTDHQVKYELKPDVRKAGGVYYTPEYIVDYIVKNTVCKLLQELPSNSSPSFRAKRGISPKIKKLRILDPACGSGSFLIRAYEEMLNYYRNQKKRSPHPTSPARGEEKIKSKTSSTGDSSSISPPLMGGDKGEGDTFGVQRTLSLPAEETEPRLTIEEKSQILREHIFGVDIDEQAVEVTKLSLMLKMLEGEFGIIPGRSILPMLDKNIRCGNSLISGSPLGLKDLFGEDFYKTKPLNWKEDFRKIILDEGGFDVIIGNPPYGGEFSLFEKKYLQQKYPAFLKNNNSYTAFFVNAVELIKNKGVIGLITPTTFLTGDNFIKLREILISQNISHIIRLPYNVFADAYIDTCICIIRKESFKSKLNVANINPKVKLRSAQEIESLIVALDKTPWLQQANYNFITNDSLLKIQQRILRNTLIKLGDFCQIDRGTLPPKKSSDLKVDEMNIFYWFDGQIYRYVFQENYSQKVKCSDLHEFKSANMFKGDRILLRQLISRQFRINATFINKSFAFKKNLYCIYNIRNNISLKYLLAIINSKLFSFYIYNSISGMQRDDFPSLSLADARSLPIRKIDFTERKDKNIHDSLVSLVDVMLDLNKKIQTAKGSQKDQIQRQITKTDKEIDEIVYKLYGITEEERKIIDTQNIADLM